MLLVESVRNSSATTITANNAFDVTIDVTKTGYTALGIVGWSCENRANFYVTGVVIVSNTAHFYGVNNTSLTSMRPSVYVLYKKN